MLLVGYVTWNSRRLFKFTAAFIPVTSFLKKSLTSFFHFFRHVSVVHQLGKYYFITRGGSDFSGGTPMTRTEWKERISLGHVFAVICLCDFETDIELPPHAHNNSRCLSYCGAVSSALKGSNYKACFCGPVRCRAFKSLNAQKIQPKTKTCGCGSSKRSPTLSRRGTLPSW